MAAVTGARIASYLRNHLHVKQIIYWSDSQIVLCWLSSNKDLKRFVQNRVKQIHQATGSATWNYCPSSDNPADLLTCGIQTDALFTSHMWNHGPSWLTRQDTWPTWDSKTVLLQSSVHDDAETGRKTPPLEPISNLPDPTSDNSISQIINHTRFSDLQRLLRTTAWVIRFAKSCETSHSHESCTFCTGARSCQECLDTHNPEQRIQRRNHQLTTEECPPPSTRASTSIIHP